MPPHCDTLDGPVVIAAKEALKQKNVNLILPYAPKGAEAEIKKAFEKAIKARKSGKEAAEVADYWFFETVVRLHREGEGAGYTGLKPAGLDTGPVIPLAEKALETGNLKELFGFMSNSLHEDLHRRFGAAIKKKDYDVNDVPAARAYVQASLGFLVHCHHLFMQMESEGHEQEGGKEDAKGKHRH